MEKEHPSEWGSPQLVSMYKSSPRLPDNLCSPPPPTKGRGIEIVLLFYWQIKGKLLFFFCRSSDLLGKTQDSTPSRSEGRLTQKTREERPQSFQASSLYTFVSSPLSLPYVNWAIQEGCLFYLRSSLWSSELPLFYCCGLSPSLSFSHHHFGLLFLILPNLRPSRDGRPNSWGIGTSQFLWLLPAERGW